MDWSEIPSLSALRALEAAIRHGSLSRAAAELNVTHAAIAQHVRLLETEFGSSLLNRQGRGVAGTVEGKRLAEALARGFAEIEDGVLTLKQDQNSRPLCVSTTPSFASNWLMPRIGDFWQTHPEITVNINPSIALTDLRQEGFDFAIRYGDGDWPEYEVKMLTGGSYWVVAAPQLLGDRVVTCLNDVIDLPWLLENHVLEHRRMIEAEGVDINKVNVKLLNLNTLVTSATAAGHGVAVQPRSIVEQDVQSGVLVKICELHTPELGYYILHRKGVLTPKQKTFFNWIRETARQKQAEML